MFRVQQVGEHFKQQEQHRPCFGSNRMLCCARAVDCCSSLERQVSFTSQQRVSHVLSVARVGQPDKPSFCHGSLHIFRVTLKLHSCHEYEAKIRKKDSKKAAKVGYSAIGRAKLNAGRWRWYASFKTWGGLSYHPWVVLLFSTPSVHVFFLRGSLYQSIKTIPCKCG